MSLIVLDGAGDPQPLKTSTPAGEHIAHHNVDTLPSAFTVDTTAIKVAVQALAAIISGSRFPVDLSSTITTYLSSLPTLAGAITASRMAVNVDSTTTGKLDSIITALGSHLSTLAGTVSASRVAVDLTTAVTGYLQTLAGAVSSSRVQIDTPPPTTLYAGSRTVVSAGTSVALASSQALKKGTWVRAKDANTGLVYVGPSGASSTSHRLAPSEPVWLDIDNLASAFVDAAVSGEGVTYCGS